MTHSPRTCPQCNHPIPQGNERCNLCGFDYQEHLKKQAQAAKKQPKQAIGSAISGLVLFLFVLGFVVPLFSDFLTNTPPEKLFEYMSLMPIVMPLLFIIIFGVVFAIIIIKQVKK